MNIRSLVERSAIAASLLLSGCGDSPAPATLLTLADTYQAVGAGRILSDGVSPIAILPVAFTLTLSVSGGHAIGQLLPSSGAAAPVSGDFDAAMSKLALLPLDAALTGTSSERIEQLGGNVADSKPSNGIADELTGYLRTSRGGTIFDGSFLAISMISGRPPKPDRSKISVHALPLGKTHLAGTAGAVPALAGVDVIIYRLADHQPDYAQGQAGSDGAFQLDVPAVSGDLLLIRADTVGVVGPILTSTISG